MLTTTNQNKWDKRFLEMAELVAGWSKDPRTKCGAVLVRRDRTIASVGFNGFPIGMRDDESLYADREEKLTRVVHAEMNAILHCKDSEDMVGYTLYTWPFLPCDRCAPHIIQSYITEVVAPRVEDFRWPKTKEFFEECGILVREI